MLQELRITNVAVIDEVSLEFGPGLNVLTGETGAGKTIVLNALGLIMGARGSADLIRSGEDEAQVEALFSAVPEVVRDRLDASGNDGQDGLVLKRTVSRAGKSRIHLNGGLANLSLLGEIGSHLIHIYGQHEHQYLLRAETHLSLLDAHAGFGAKVQNMKVKFSDFASAWRRLQAMKGSLADKDREEEFLKAQIDEITMAALVADEEEALQARKMILVNAERLFQIGKEGETILYEADHAVVGELGRYIPRLREMADIDGSLREAVELLEGAAAQLDEATGTIRHYTDRLHFDPQELERIEDRLVEIGRLKRKYRGSVAEILEFAEESRRKLAALESGEDELKALEEQCEVVRQTAWATAEELSKGRKKAAKDLKKQMERAVKEIGLDQTIFEARFGQGQADDDAPPFVVGGMRIDENGIDDVEFYFSPNPGETVKPLAKIASGGELSRLMLALKSLILSQADIPTQLFDEVDAGIGGKVAEMVGQKLARVAETHQVVCVTHLPQIAALAQDHYVVEKTVSEGRTYTTVKKLSDKERITELARMLGGAEISEHAERHAEAMLKVHNPDRSQ